MNLPAKLTRAKSTRLILVLLWTLALLLGLVQTWYMRHRIFSDGISYLEIASNYAAGNWHDALNAYWSPLYSWIIALAFVLLHPAPYWQVATLHLVNFLAYAAGLFALSRLLHEFMFFRAESGLSQNAIYLGGYTAYIFAGLHLITIGYCSPDMLAMFLIILLATWILRVVRDGGGLLLYVGMGVVLGLCFLARTAFAALSPFFLLPIAFGLRSRRKSWIKPLLIIAGSALLTAGPFVAALSLKEHRFTLGDSGKLNYGWEISGAARSIHWQGEPHDIGAPLHATTMVIAHPATYVFNGSPVPGSYPPWYDPSFWYAGIQPRLRLGAQCKAFFFNAAYSTLLLVMSPAFIPCALLMLVFGRRAAWLKLASFWPVLLPCLAGIALYCIVFVDRRYIAAFLLVLWLASLLSVVNLPAAWRPRTSMLVQSLCILFLLVVEGLELSRPMKLALADLIHGREAEQNLNYLLAQRFEQLGLKPGDKIAYIGQSINADWTRLDHVQIVGEVPVRYLRAANLRGSKVFDDVTSIGEFWHADSATRTKVLNAFRVAGAKMVVTDGFHFTREADRWPAVLRPRQPGLPFSGGEFPDQENSRFFSLQK